MLQIDVTVPEFGEITTLPGGGTMVADEGSVIVTVGNGEQVLSAFQLPADGARDLAHMLVEAARSAKPSGARGLIGRLRRNA